MSQKQTVEFANPSQNKIAKFCHFIKKKIMKFAYRSPEKKAKSISWSHRKITKFFSQTQISNHNFFQSIIRTNCEICQIIAENITKFVSWSWDLIFISQRDFGNDFLETRASCSWYSLGHKILPPYTKIQALYLYVNNIAYKINSNIKIFCLFVKWNAKNLYNKF